MDEYSLSQIMHKTFTTLSQLKYYVNYGLLPHTIFEDKILMTPEQVKRIYEIKLFINMNFSLKEIKIIFDNATKTNIQLVLTHYYALHWIATKNFYLEFNRIICENNLEKPFSTLSFKLLSNFATTPTILTILFAAKKEWYQNDFEKKFLKNFRKQVYKHFIDYNSSKYKEVIKSLELVFEEFYDFLVSKELDSWLYFYGFIHWITWEPRYLKEMKRLTKINFSTEICEIALKWIILRTN
ncbi:hypothetical protein SCLARK_001150 [Spiroplasma clarkii]|uniref:HTH merR-type domain-containing protein n=1 Tax=Spiroplasma clarkii TaxID=2139 RepID=A0A1Y0L143_9MOLU|nr:MerR family transcriptional regulator [Spiroplasma clarkii]ARU91711.1 hypothetical protein SCLARK_001150 [Spiroplasma clarkii]ATX71100.1 hypothetical protein SCLAR_v1c07850 [Spiroplasma clarkii]